ncbi:hypothetical protein EJD97_014463, partial [Solanum chilense]
MFREWKIAKRMDKYTIAPDRFNVGYDKGYKEWLKKDIKNVSSQTQHRFRSVTNKEANAVAKVQEVKKEAQEVYTKFVENQGTLEKATQEVERLRCGYDDFDTWVKEKIEMMRYESLDDKRRMCEGFLLMLRHIFQQYRTQGDGDEAG